MSNKLSTKVFPVCVLSQRLAQLLSRHLDGYFLTKQELEELRTAINSQLAPR